MIFPNTFYSLAFALFAILASPLHASIITFESPYTPGAIGALNGSTSNAPFTGQQGWSLSTSASPGGIETTTDSGDYVGGQALSGVLTYIGGQLSNTSVTGVNTISFDVKFSGGSAALGFFGGTSGSGFSNSDTGVMFGFAGNQLLTVRNQGFGSTFNANLSASDLGVDTNDWLRYSVTLAEEISLSRLYTVGIRNLTDSVDIDLNGAGAGNLYSGSVGAASVGVAPEDARGGFIRISSGFVDNVTYTVVPEPSFFALIAGIFGLTYVMIWIRNRFYG